MKNSQNFMRTAVVYANDDIRYVDYPMPEPKADEIRIAVKAAGICGSDIPRVLKNGAHFYPIVLGHEFSGVIDKLGDDVKGFSVGERATAAPLIPCHKCEDCLNGNYALCKNYTFIGSRIQGAFADYVCVPSKNVVKFSDNVSFMQGAFFEPSTVALHGINVSDFHRGESVAILGGGTIGLFTMQWCKILGAKSVAVFDINDERLNLAKELGADTVYNTLSKDFMDKALLETNGKGYKNIYETAGNATTMKMAFSLTANKANVCFIGTPTTEVVFEPKLWENLNRKEFKLTGSWMSYSASFPGKEWTDTAKHFSDGTLKFSEKLVYKKYPLKDIKEAFDLFKEPEKVKGKVMILKSALT